MEGSLPGRYLAAFSRYHFEPTVYRAGFYSIKIYFQRPEGGETNGFTETRKGNPKGSGGMTSPETKKKISLKIGVLVKLRH